MFKFLCATASEADAIARHGLDLDENVQERLLDNLDAAEAEQPDRILVLRRRTLNDALGTKSLAHLQPEAFVNLSPYKPPRRVEAGGGYVMRGGAVEPEVLLIFRRGRWDLPKGKRDAGESVQECALREVREELGISRLQLIAPLGTTLHGYPERGRYRVKTTFWFLMRTSETRFAPQAEEDIERVQWMPYSEAIEAVGFETLARHMKTVRALVYEHLDL